MGLRRVWGEDVEAVIIIQNPSDTYFFLRVLLRNAGAAMVRIGFQGAFHYSDITILHEEYWQVLKLLQIHIPTTLYKIPVCISYSIFFPVLFSIFGDNKANT